MGIWDFLFGNSDDDDDDEEEEYPIDPQEVDETMEIIDDPEFDEWAAAGHIKNTNPPGTEGVDDENWEDDDNGRDTEPIKMPGWWPFR